MPRKKAGRSKGGKRGTGATTKRVLRTSAKPARNYKAENDRRNAAARAAGFKNRYELARVSKQPKVAAALKLAGIQRGPQRALCAGLAAGRVRFPGRKGSQARKEFLAKLAGAIRRAGGNPSAFFGAIGSPPRKARRISAEEQELFG